jgi:hypothetical protein
MSNFDSGNKSTPPTSAPLENLKWRSIKSDLRAALQEWEVLESEVANKSPEQEHLERVKGLIEKIKGKLDQF